MFIELAIREAVIVSKTLQVLLGYSNRLWEEESSFMVLDTSLDFTKVDLFGPLHLGRMSLDLCQDYYMDQIL